MPQTPSRPALALWAPLLALAPLATAQELELSAPLPRLGLGAIREFEVTPDGSRVVYVADQELDEVFELFAAPADGIGASRRLSAGGAVADPRIAGARVVYRGHQEANGSVELFVVPLDGTADPVNLSGALAPGGTVIEFQLAAAAVVYEANELGDSRFELFRAPLDGSSPAVRLHAPLASLRRIERFEVSTDGAFVLYSSDADRLGVFELYRAPSDGSAPGARIHPPLPDLLDVSAFALAPDGGRVALAVSYPDRTELYRLAATGGAPPLHLTAGLTPGSVADFGFAPDSRTVVFRHAGRLYASSPAGPIALDDPTASGEVLAFEVAADGRGVLFASGFVQYTGVLVEQLWFAPIDGASPPVELAAPSLFRFGDGSDVFALDAGGTRAVYLAQAEDGSVPLFARPVDASAPAVRLDGSLALQGRVEHFRMAGERVLYLAEERARLLFELFSVPAGGGSAPARLNGPIRSDRGVQDYRIAAGGARVVFLADQDPHVTTQLFAAPVDAATEAVALGSPLPLGPVIGDVLDFQAAGPRVVYRADEQYRVAGLYAAPRDGHSPRLELAGPAWLGYVHDWLVTPDGRNVLFRRESQGPRDLFAVRSDGTSGEVRLADVALGPLQLSPDGRWAVYGNVSSVRTDGSAPPIVLDSRASLVRIAPDSRRVVFASDRESANRHELWTRALDGSDAAVKLSGPMVPLGDVLEAEIGPDSRRVIYRADQEADGRVELYSAPLDASAGAVRVSAPVVPGGDVVAAEIAADGARAVYLADQDADEVFELFSAPLDASAAPLRLSGTLVPGGNVTAFCVDPTARRVVFRADAERDERFELYAAPIDGSLAPVKLSPALVGGGDVEDGFVLTPDGLRVLLRADHARNGETHLLVAPVDGSAPAVQLSAPLQAGGRVLDFVLAASGRDLVYRAHADGGARAELFGVPISGARAARRLHAPLRADADVADDYRVADGLVLFRADRDEDGVLELFASWLPAPRVTTR